ncbi:hypothetical protein D3C84_1306530 [compost metagenome]
MQRLPGAIVIKHITIRLNSDGKTVGDAYPLSREVLVHLAQRGVLAPDQRYIVDTQLFEPADM